MEWVIDTPDAGERLDKVLTNKGIGSRNYCQELIKSGLVHVNGKPVKKRLPARVGDRISCSPKEEPERKLSPYAMPLEVIYEDDDLIVVNKPCGIATHPAPNHTKPTLVEALMHHCQTLPPSDDPLRPGIVHRLDKETTGLLIAAKSPEALEELSKAFAERRVKKTYLAVTVGNPGQLTIETQIGRNPNKRQEMAVLANGGKKAITHITPLSWDHELALLSIEIETGRTHQIRVHLKHCKTPVLGDSTYGSEKMNQRKKAIHQLLHAHKLTFNHPISHEELSFTSPVPKHWSPFV